jgi:hypothetical protein
MAAERYLGGDFPKAIRATRESAYAFCEIASVNTKRNLSLPTLEMLQEGLVDETIIPIGKEWTKEGFLFDSLTGKVDVNPSAEAVAGFRIIEKYPVSPQND